MRQETVIVRWGGSLLYLEKASVSSSLLMDTTDCIQVSKRLDADEESFLDHMRL